MAATSSWTLRLSAFLIRDLLASSSRRLPAWSNMVFSSDLQKSLFLRGRKASALSSGLDVPGSRRSFLMMPRRLARLAAIALVVGGSFIGAGVAAAQPAQQPSAAAVSMAKEIMDAKGSFTMFEPLVPGVIETA